MATTFTGWSDTDANGILTYWLQGGFGATVYVGLALTLPTDSTGDGYSEPWLPAPSITSITSVSTGGSIAGGSTRYYKVTALNASGETTPSLEAVYTVPTGTNTNVVTVSWGAISGATGYNVAEATTSGAEVKVATGLTTTYYQDMTGGGNLGSLPSMNTTGYGYQRAAVAANATNFPTATGRVITNGTGIYFPTPTASWGVPIGVLLFDGAQSSANFRASGLLNAPLGPTVGTPPFFPANTFAIPFN